jgi:hypothetical protein
MGLTLYWQALGPVGADYTVLVHLLDAEGGIAGQGDGPPAGGFYPTHVWDPGEVVVDEHAVAIQAGTPPGTYQLVVGLYRLSTGQRLATAGGQDVVLLGEVEVK